MQDLTFIRLIETRLLIADRPLLDLAPFVPSLYKGVLARFKDPALDQEIKEQAVACM